MSFCFNYREKTFEDNYYLKKYKKGRYKELQINEIKFVNNKSVQDEILYFTNKFQRKTGARIDSIKNFVHDLIKTPQILNDFFDGEDISHKSNTNDDKKLKRLDGILKLYEEYPINSLVYKYAPNEKYYKQYNNGEYERGFQIFFTHNDNTINVYLIDLYHLAIPSKDNNPKEEYNKRKNYNKCISECIFNE